MNHWTILKRGKPQFHDRLQPSNHEIARVWGIGNWKYQSMQCTWYNHVLPIYLWRCNQSAKQNSPKNWNQRILITKNNRYFLREIEFWRLGKSFNLKDWTNRSLMAATFCNVYIDHSRRDFYQLMSCYRWNRSIEKPSLHCGGKEVKNSILGGKRTVFGSVLHGVQFSKQYWISWIRY